MYINIYHRQQGTNKAECITSYDDFNYFVVDETSKFVVKPDFIAPDVHNKEYSYKRYYYMLESFDGTKEQPTDTKNYVPIVKETKTSKKQLEYAKKYQSKFAEIKLRLPEELKEQVKGIAADQGISVNEYLIQLIKANM